MEVLSTKIIKVGLRLTQKPINSTTLILLSTLFNIMVIVLILSPYSPSTPSGNENPIPDFLFRVRRYMYYLFLQSPNHTQEHIAFIGLAGLTEIIFLYLACKELIKDRERTLLKVLYFGKIALALPILAVIISSFRCMQDSKYIYVKVSACVVVLVSSTTEYLCEYLNFTCLYTSLRKQDQAFDCLTPKIKLCLKIIVVYVVLKEDITRQEKIVFSVILLLLYVGQIWKLMASKICKYTPLLEIANYLGWILVASYNLVTLFQLNIKLIEDNKWLVLSSLFIWSSLAYYNVLEYTKGLLLIQSPQLIKSQSEAITYIRLLYNVYENRQETSSSILLLGLVKDHSSDCRNVECICKTRTKLMTSSLIKDEEFFLEFIESSIRTLRQRFDCVGVDIACLAFQVEVMKKFPLYFFKADMFRKRNEHKKMLLHEKFAIHEIEKIALQQVLQKSSDSEISNQKSLQLMKSEKNIEECYLKLQKIVLHFGNFYKYNSRTYCGLELLKKELEEIYKIMRQIMEIFDEKKQIEDHLSSELIFLILFFYQNIFNLAFKTKPILLRLEMLYKRLQLKQISQQNFDVSLYSENGCVIQSTLQSNVFGLITKISSNTAQIFKYPSVESMLNSDIHRLLPRCSREEHLRMVKRWLETGSFKKINKLHETFCYDYEENLFKALMRSQIAVIDGKISVFVGLIKTDSDNYMILNRKGQIDSYGNDFGKLANECRYKNIQDLIPAWRTISQDLTRQPRTLKTKLISHPKKPQQKRHQAQLKFLSSPVPETQQYHLTLQIYVGSMRYEQFIVLRKLSYTKIEGDSKCTLSGSMNSQRCLDEREFTNANRSSKFLTTNLKDANNMGFEIGSTSSTTNDAHFSVWRMLEEMSIRATADSLDYPLLHYITIVLIILFVIIMGTIACLFVLETRGLDSFNEIIFADSAVSDNMQLMEMIYNSIIMLGQHCHVSPDPVRCQETKNSLTSMENILTELLARDIEDVVRNVTFLGHKYFAYEIAEVNATYNGTIVTVGTFQFMENYVRESKHLLNSLKSNDYVPDFDDSIENLRANWKEMKRINYQNLKFYQAVGINELDTCIYYAIALSVVYGVLVTCYALAQFYLSQSEEKFLNRILTVFRRISIKTSEQLTTYYEELTRILGKKDSRQMSNTEAPQISQSQSLILHSFTPYRDTRSAILLSVYWLIFVLFIAISTFKVSEYNGLQKNSIFTLNNLMNSENHMFEAYFEMKALYLYSDYGPADVQALYDGVLSKLGREQNQFVKTALMISNLAAEQDIGLADEFSQLLIRNICDSTAYEACKSIMNMGILEEGILTAMTFFQNTIFQTAQKLKNSEPLSFDSKEHQGLDLYLLYMLRLYQQTQASMINILNFIMSQRMQSIDLLIAIQLVLQLGSILVWFWGMAGRRRRLSECYGYVLVFPVQLIKESKFMQQYLGQLL